MIRALVQAAERFQTEGKLPPTGYKPKIPKWIITLEGTKAYLEGPYTARELDRVYAPDRQRSGTSPEPFLLFDKAQYVLGIPKDDAKSAELHEKFMTLLKEAAEYTGEESLYRIIEFLQDPRLEGLEKIAPKDLVAIRAEPDRYPFELDSVQEFWAKYLSSNLTTQYQAICSICGKHNNVLRILPREVVVLGQKCQITSFNKNAFLSFGREQTANAPICFDCASKAIDALDYLIRDEKHHKSLWFNPRTNNSLENQLAVFWLDKRVEVSFEDKTYDVEELLSLVFIEEDPDSVSLVAELSQLEELLSLPWTAREAALRLNDRYFYLAILSANKGRLVVREWLETNLETIKSNLGKFLQATRIISPWGDEPRPLSIHTLVSACEGASPNITRGLLRTAFLGYAPPHELLGAALRRFRLPNVLQDSRNARQLQALAAALKLQLFYGREEVKRMDQLDSQRKSPAYLCGRLLAVLEEAQQRASGFKLNKTVVDRFYGAASTAPAATFGGLLRLATTAHLPEVGREVNELVEEILSLLDEVGGFPKTLTQKEQAEFALGFYHQRAHFRAQRGKKETQTGGEEQRKPEEEG